MAFFYQDTDGGSDASDGTTWANAKLTLEGLFAVMSAGDTGFIQGAADDTVAATRTFTSPGIMTNPCKIIGVVDGTTNTGTSIVEGDLAITLPHILGSNVANDIFFQGFCTYINIHVTSPDKVTFNFETTTTLVNSKLTYDDDMTSDTQSASVVLSELVLINSILETTSAAASIVSVDVRMFGGFTISTTLSPIMEGTNNAANARADFVGVDFSSIGTTVFISGDGTTQKATLKNCRVPAVFNLYGSTPTLQSSIEVIGCSNASSVLAADSIQDYQYQDAHGTIDGEFTAVRTGGADDDASGLFAYAMTPAADATLESSGATLKSPWCSVWVDGGSNTLTMYIANDSASTDYNQDEAWVEFYTPDAGDTAQYDQTFDAGDARLVDSTTAITDDTGSTWGTGANNHQKFSATVTTGYTGWAYARLHLAKRDATPDTLFLDPRIEVS